MARLMAGSAYLTAEERATVMWLVVGELMPTGDPANDEAAETSSADSPSGSTRSR